jgi:hypothetical protein
VPIAINVNMLRFRVNNDCAPRAKNGHPAHSTTGVASASWTQLEIVWLTRCRPKRCCPISSTKTGTVSASPIQNRRVMSASSGLGPLSAVTTSGSSAMPQIGQFPGPA